MGVAAEFKAKLRVGEVCIGSWVNFTDPCVTELMCGSGYDFLIFDAEHSALNIETIQLHMIATKGTQTVPIVRVAWNDMVRIKQVLDVGAAGVLIPLVKTAEDVKRAVDACLYPPQGVRGFGPRRPANYERCWEEYIEVANRDMIVFVQIEHIDAINNLEEILAVPGLTGVFIAFCDLSGSLGVLGKVDHPMVQEAVETFIAKTRETNVAVGMAGARTPEGVFKWISKGMQFMTMGNDMGFLSMTSDNSVTEIRKLIQQAGR